MKNVIIITARIRFVQSSPRLLRILNLQIFKSIEDRDVVVNSMFSFGFGSSRMLPIGKKKDSIARLQKANVTLMVKGLRHVDEVLETPGVEVRGDGEETLLDKTNGEELGDLAMKVTEFFVGVPVGSSDVDMGSGPGVLTLGGGSKFRAGVFRCCRSPGSGSRATCLKAFSIGAR